MPERGDEQVARRVRELVQQREHALAAMHDERLARVEPTFGLCAEDAAAVLVGLRHVFETPRGPERLRHDRFPTTGCGALHPRRRSGIMRRPSHVLRPIPRRWLVAYPFVASPNVNHTSGRHIDLIVIHTMEMDEKGDTAESCAHWFQNPAAQVSAHYCVDSDSIVQCVRDQDVAWHAPGANFNGVGIEHAGRAKQTGRDWGDDYSTAMLERSAGLTASLCKKYKIPVTWLQPADLLAGKRGITSHNNVSKAFKRGTHWDPGEGFPIQAYLEIGR